MQSWFEQTLQQAQQVHDWLSPQRQQSLHLLQRSQWPTLKTEAWKYTPLRALDLAQFDATSADQPNNIEPVAIDGFQCIDIVFANGKLQTDLSSLELPEGLTVRSLADSESGSQDVIENVFGKIKSPKHLFGLINDTLVTQGLVIDVAPDVDINTAIRISHAYASAGQSHGRTLVNVGKNSKLSVVEHFSGNVPGINTHFAEFAVAEAAQLQHCRFMLQGGQAISIGGCHFKLQQLARLNTNIIGFGSELSRLDVDILHAGEEAYAQLQGIYLLDDRELFDLHTNVEHCVPRCTTEEIVRGVAGGESRAVFNGRIHIHRNAQKTLAELNNRNLLLSDRAEINTKPELEIYADDVRCAHGATVSQMDEKSLYYLRSRGIGRQQAQVILNFAFINQLLDKIDSQPLADWMRQQLQQRFAAMTR